MMIIGVPKEIKDMEYRVSLTPGGAEFLTQDGHQVLVESGAGDGSGFSNEEYVRGGAEIVEDPGEVWRRAEMVMKVKEPLAAEYPYLRDRLILFTYLHLAANEAATQALVGDGVTAIAYETVQRPDGSLPLLIPMSEVAGRMSVQIGAHYLEKTSGGRGKLLGGVPGVRPATVVIVGGGTVGTNAAAIALGMGAHVVIVDIDADRLRYLCEILHGNLTTISSNPRNVAEAVSRADLVIGAVLVPAARAPVVVSRRMVEAMKPGSVIVDVAVDQGGCVETSRPTTHSEPIYDVNGVVHYCVANMPGAVPRTSTYALSNVTLPYAAELARLGFVEAVRRDAALASGVNVCQGQITSRPVAEALGQTYRALDALIG